MCSRLFWPGKSVTSAGLGKTSTKLRCSCCRAITGRCTKPEASNRFTNVRMRPPSWNAGLDRLAGYGAASQAQNISVSCRSTGRHLRIPGPPRAHLSRPLLLLGRPAPQTRKCPHLSRGRPEPSRPCLHHRQWLRQTVSLHPRRDQSRQISISRPPGWAIASTESVGTE